ERQPGVWGVKLQLDAVRADQQHPIGVFRHRLEARQGAPGDERDPRVRSGDESQQCRAGLGQGAGLLWFIDLGGQGAIEVERNEQTRGACELQERRPEQLRGVRSPWCGHDSDGLCWFSMSSCRKADDHFATSFTMTFLRMARILARLSLLDISTARRMVSLSPSMSCGLMRSD